MIFEMFFGLAMMVLDIVYAPLGMVIDATWGVQSFVMSFMRYFVDLTIVGPWLQAVVTIKYTLFMMTIWRLVKGMIL